LGAKVPQINGSIYIKVLKTKDHNQSKLFHVDKLKKADILRLNSHDNHHHHQNIHSAPKPIHENPHSSHIPNPVATNPNIKKEPAKQN
jgi:hypothetical protein